MIPDSSETKIDFLNYFKWGEQEELGTMNSPSASISLISFKFY